MQVSRIALSDISNSRKQSVSNRVNQQSQNQQSFSAYKYGDNFFSDWLINKIRPLADLPDSKYKEFLESDVRIYKANLTSGIKSLFLSEDTFKQAIFTRIYDYYEARTAIKNSQLEHVMTQNFEIPAGKFSSRANKEAFEVEEITTPSHESDIHMEDYR